MREWKMQEWNYRDNNRIESEHGVSSDHVERQLLERPECLSESARLPVTYQNVLES